MLDLQKVALNEKVITYDKKILTLGKIAEYWNQKILNITNSGMSYEGFTMGLNVTQKREKLRRRASANISGLKNQGGITNGAPQS